MSIVTTFPDGKPRCHWCAATAQYTAYHDEEWGYPVADDQRLFEKLCLESFQSGLSWRTILEKRENFRRAFCQFDFRQMARFDESDVQRLLADAGIAALTLLVAESDPQQKDTLIRLIMHMLAHKPAELS